MAMIGRHKVSQQEHAEVWLVSYADMMTLLFGFFVILHSISNFDDQKLSQVGRQLAETFEGKIEKKEGSDTGVLMEGRQVRALQLLVAMLNMGDNVEAFVEKIEKSIQDTKNLDAAKQALAQQFKEDSADTLDLLRATVLAKTDLIEIALPETALFLSGAAEVKPEGKAALARVATYLNRIQGLASLEIVGHTDSVPVPRTSRYPSNWALSAARAGAVADELLKHGIEPRSLLTRGMASLQPLFPERRPDGTLIRDNLAKNRRVSIIVKKAHSSGS